MKEKRVEEGGRGSRKKKKGKSGRAAEDEKRRERTREGGREDVRCWRVNYGDVEAERVQG